MKRNKRISIKEFFYFYPYKKNPPIVGKTIPQPYVKQEDEKPDHDCSLTYNEWRLIVDSYIDAVKKVVMTGREVMLDNYMGTLGLKKYPISRRIDYKQTRLTGKKVYFTTPNQYQILLKWRRTHSNARFNYKFHWRVKPVKTFTGEWFKRTEKDPDFIYNIPDV